MAAENNSKRCAITGAILVALLALAAGAAYYFLNGLETTYVLPDDHYFDYIEEHVGCRNEEESINNEKSFPRSEDKNEDHVNNNDVVCHFEKSQLKSLQEDVLQNKKLLKPFASEQSHTHQEPDFDTELTIYLTLYASPINSRGKLKSIPNELLEIPKKRNQNIIFKVSSTESVNDLKSRNSDISITLPHSEIDSYVIGKLLQGQNVREYNDGEENIRREKMRISHPLKWYTRNIRATHTNETLNVSDESYGLSLKDIEMKNMVSQKVEELLSNFSETQVTTGNPKHSKWNPSHINRRRCRERRRRLENSLKMDVIVAVDYSPPNTHRALNWSSERFNLRWPSVRKCLKHVINDWTLEFMYNTTVFRARTKFANTLRYCLSLERKRYEKLLEKFSTMEGCLSKKAKQLQKVRLSEDESEEPEKNETLELNRKTRHAMKRKHKRRRKRHHPHKFKKRWANILYDNQLVTTEMHYVKNAENETSVSKLESKEVVSMAQINSTTSEKFGIEALQKIYGTHRSEIDEKSNPLVQVSVSNKLNESPNTTMKTEMQQILRGDFYANISLNLLNESKESADKKEKANNVSLLENKVPMEQFLKLIHFGNEDKQTVENFLQIILQNIPREDVLNMNQSLNTFVIKYIPKLLSSINIDEIKEKIFENYSKREKSSSESSIRQRRGNWNHNSSIDNENVQVHNNLSTTNNEQISNSVLEQNVSRQTFYTKRPIYYTNETTIVEEKESSEETKEETVNESSRTSLHTLPEDNDSLHEQHGIHLRSYPGEIVTKSNEEEESKGAYRAILTRYIGGILQRLPVAEIRGDIDETSERSKNVHSKMEDITSYVQKVLERIPVEALSRNINRAGQNISITPEDRDALLNYIQSMIEEPINDKLNYTSKDDTKTIPLDQKILWKYIHGVARLISDGVANAEKSTQDIQLPSQFALNTSLESIIPDIKYLIELEKENRRMKQSQSSLNEKTVSSITDRRRKARESNQRENGKYPWILPEPAWKNNFFDIHNIPRNNDVPNVPGSVLMTSDQKKEENATNFSLPSSSSRKMDEASETFYGRAKRVVNTSEFNESSEQNILIQSEQLKNIENTVTSKITETDTDKYSKFINKLADRTLFGSNAGKNHRTFSLKRQAMLSNKDTKAQNNVLENDFYHFKRKELTETAREFLRKLNMKLDNLKHKTLERLERSHTNIDKSNESFLANASYKDPKKIFGFQEIREDKDIKRPGENFLSSALEQINNLHTQMENSERFSDQSRSPLHTDLPRIKQEVVHKREKHEIPQDASQSNLTNMDKLYAMGYPGSGEKRGVVLSEYARASPTLDVSCSRKKAAVAAAVDADDAAVAVALLSLGLFTAAVFLLKVTRVWGGARRLVSLWNLSPRSDSGDEIISDGHMVDIETGLQQNSGPAMRSKKGDPLELEKIFFIEGDGGGELSSSAKEHVSRTRAQPMTSPSPSQEPPSYEQHHRSRAPLASRVLGLPARFNSLPPSPMNELPMTWTT